MRIIPVNLIFPIYIINSEFYKAEQKLKEGEIYNFEFDSKKYSITKRNENCYLDELDEDIIYPVKKEQLASEINDKKIIG